VVVVKVYVVVLDWFLDVQVVLLVPMVEVRLKQFSKVQSGILVVIVEEILEPFLEALLMFYVREI
jgi:hypothetical protein